jgi:hypothetical protein
LTELKKTLEYLASEMSSYARIKDASTELKAYGYREDAERVWAHADALEGALDGVISALKQDGVELPEPLRYR